MACPSHRSHGTNTRDLPLSRTKTRLIAWSGFALTLLPIDPVIRKLHLVVVTSVFCVGLTRFWNDWGRRDNASVCKLNRSASEKPCGYQKSRTPPCSHRRNCFIVLSNFSHQQKPFGTLSSLHALHIVRGTHFWHDRRAGAHWAHTVGSEREETVRKKR